MVTRLGQGQTGFFGKQLNHACREACRGIDAGAHSGAAQGNLSHAGQGRIHSFNAVTHSGGVAREFLPQGNGGCIHQVGASRLDDVLELCGLLFQRCSENLKGGDQLFDQCLGHGNMHGGGENIVGRLGGVHMVIGVNLNAL